jgi:hypothetical protein
MNKVPASFRVKKNYKKLNLFKGEYYWRDHNNVYLQVFTSEKTGNSYPGFFFGRQRLSKTVTIKDFELLSLRKEKVVSIPRFEEESEINENSFLVEQSIDSYYYEGSWK